MTTFPDPEPMDTGTPQQVAEEALLADLETEVEAAAATLDMEPLDHRRRLLVVHAHPDDEVIGTGTTMAAYASRGDLVTLVTCTRGELGEVVDPEQADLASTGPDDDRLGERRVEELAVAMEALGVTDHRFLGGPGRWRDSGMEGEPSNDDPRSFWRADFEEATAAMVAIVREVRPQVVVTYDQEGGYGHPDHVQAHRVAVAGAARAADEAYRPDLGEPWQVSRLLYLTIPRSFIQMGIDAGIIDSGEDIPNTTPDDEISVTVDGSAWFDAKVAAMRAHKTQIDLSQGIWSVLVAVPEFANEHFVLLSGDALPEMPAPDLFAGLAV